MSQTITITLPDHLYDKLERLAKLSQQSVDVVIAQSLIHSLPPLLDDIPKAYQADVYPLLHMNESELQRELRRVFPPAQWVEYERLLDKKKAEALTAEETARLEMLGRESDALMYRRNYAGVLLKRRGYPLPTLEELDRTE